MIRLVFSCFLLSAFSANIALGVVLEDFQGGWAGAGALITDPADAANTVLHLTNNRDDGGTPPDIFTIDTNGFVGKVTMDIYDFGATTWDGLLLPPFATSGGTDNGPRWGVQGDSDLDGTLDNWVAAGIIQKSFFSANGNYAYIHDNIADDGQRAVTFQSDWFSPANFGNPRRVKTSPLNVQPSPGNGIQLIGTGTPDVPQVPGSGAWTTWEFDIAADNTVTITALAGTEGKFLDAPFDTDTVSTYQGADMTVINMQQIWITGGHDVSGFDNINSLGTHGVLIDNITFDGVMSSNPDGDFNDDGTVDAADFTVFRDNEGSGTALPNDNGLGTPIGAAHYTLWSNNFNATASNATAVPEPSSLALMALVALGFAGRRGTKVA